MIPSINDTSKPISFRTLSAGAVRNEFTALGSTHGGRKQCAGRLLLPIQSSRVPGEVTYYLDLLC
jgi:hypothetical protein